MVDKGKAAEKKKEPPSPNKPKPPNMLKEDQIIAAESGNKYVVEHILGKGGFGEVFKVSLYGDPEKKFAMKVEKIKAKKNQECMLRLKVELHVFKTIAATPDSVVDKTHFVKMHDKGITATFKYYVMDVIWMSLDDVIKKVLKMKLSSSTIIQIARQSLKGIESLHEMGFLHRDIKAANYAVGLPPKDNIIYLLDFGIARPYKDQNGEVTIPREKVQFLGTIRYASVRAMQKLEQCRKDDLEVWMYMMLEIYWKDNLWWRKLDSSQSDFFEQTLAAKIDLQHTSRTKLGMGVLKMPHQFCSILENIKKMKYRDAGDFKYINTVLSGIVMEQGIDESLRLDWIGKMPPPEASKRDEKRSHQVSRKDSNSKDVSKKLTMDDSKDSAKNGRNVDKKNGRKKVSKGTQQTEEPSVNEPRKDQKRDRRRRKSRTTDDEYWKDDDDDSEDDDYSEDEEDYRRRRNKQRRSRKKRSRERVSSRRNSNKSGRDETDEQDERDDRRRRRRGKSPGEKKRTRISMKKTQVDDDEDVPKIPEPKDSLKMKRSRKKSKNKKSPNRRREEKTVDVDQKKMEGQTPEIEKEVNDKKDKDKNEEDVKKELNPPSAKQGSEKKTKDASPVKT